MRVDFRQGYGMEPIVLDAQGWAESQFGTAVLGDARRTKRLVRLAAQIASDPSGSLPMQTGSWNDLRGAYRLFDSDPVTFEAVASPHWELTKKTPGKIFLIIADTTEIDYGYDSAAEGLSPVGKGVGRGFHLHSGLMVSPDDERIIGLAGQLIHHRHDVPKGETRTERLKRDDRESQIWCNLTKLIGPPPPATTWIQVADRASDDFEFFYHCREIGHEWVARVKNKHRIIQTPEGEQHTLSEYVKTFPELGCYTIKIRARGGQKARTAKVVVSVGTIIMPIPKLKSPFLKQVKPEPIHMRVVSARELNPPPGVEPIDWVLYTSLPVENLDDAMKVIGYYEKRWLIEEWHKVLKTGLQVEQRQLKTSARLESMMALMSVTAVRLFQLKGEARTSPERPALEVVPPEFVTMLTASRKRDLTPGQTVGQFFRELAMLGGFLGRKGDGEPGWITIWRGWNKLQTMMRGVEAFIQANKSGL